MSSHFLIIDVEATCWESKEEHPGENEIIEIGAVLVNSENSVIWNKGWFVRPILNPILSPFCTKLTSIKQSQVDGALPLPNVLSALAADIKEMTHRPISDSYFVSWGNYDRNQFSRDCERHKATYPFGPHINLKTHFLEKFHLKKAGVPKALEVLNLPFEGTHHRGIDDALNIARVFTNAFGPKYTFKTTP